MTTTEKLTEFFTKKVPADWRTGDLAVTSDNDEVVVVIPIDGDGREFRERTREKRMKIANDAEQKFNRKVSWGIEVGGERRLFTHAALPVMTRLRLPERAVLDTLVAAGVARSRADALGWCVRLVGKHEADWLKDLEDALAHVKTVRSEGPVSL
ncbi:MAG TPA: hypothetical protein VFB78_17610 [Acidimicrobiales bacterium]|nr:hypothetical protein [Acidimicrobiales bacterium]